MASTITTSLISKATGKVLTSPTLVAGDVKISTDFGALANLTTLPVVTPAGSGIVKINLTTAEVGSGYTIIFEDQAGSEWEKQIIHGTAQVAISSAIATIDTVVDGISANIGLGVDALSPFISGDNLSAFTDDTVTYTFTVTTDYSSGYTAVMVIQAGDNETEVYDRIDCTIASATTITAEFDYDTWTSTPTFAANCNSKVANLKWFLVLIETASGDESTIASGGFYLHARGTTSA